MGREFPETLQPRSVWEQVQCEKSFDKNVDIN